MLEARCLKCGETFNPHSEDLVHFARDNGEGDECGGVGVIEGEWLMTYPGALTTRVTHTIGVLAGMYERCYTESRKDEPFHQGRAAGYVKAIALLMGEDVKAVKIKLRDHLIPVEEES